MSFARFTSLPRRSHSVLSRLVTRHRAETGAPLAASWRHAVTSIWAERNDIKRFLVQGDEALAHDLRVRFGLGAALGPARAVPQDLFSQRPIGVSDGAASILIPIFNAAHLVERLLAYLPQTLPMHQHVILVDDGSDDPAIARLTKAFAVTWPNTTVLNHLENRGFAVAVNAGLERRPKNHHLILLNTDTLPPTGWVPRLLAPFHDAPNLASVTPMSNNAEILSVPRAGIEVTPNALLIEQLDKVAQRLRPRWADIPTGIGFCMALNHRYLDRLGGFDTAYGRGYGEEVDWCCAASALGGRHAVTTNLVVGHVGHASFGASERTARIAKASRRIAERYPHYPQATLDWEAHDPIGPERLALALAWVAQTAKQAVPLIVGHSLGGGAETAMRREIAACLADGLPGVIILRVGGPAPWRLELEGTRFKLAGDIDDVALAEDMLAPVTARRVIYSCGVHATDPISVPETLCRLAEGHRLELRLHDFFPISPSWNLLDGQGRFQGVPDFDTTDPVHAIAPGRGRRAVSHQAWRASWARVVAQADEVTAFSNSSGVLITEAYPHAHAKIALRPHLITDPPPKLRAGGQSIGVLGGINLAKGGQVLMNLAGTMTRRLVVIGEMDGQFRLHARHIVHGRYACADIGSLAKQYDIGLWLMPSVCPETFSFATHEMLATGLPVVCFDLGAQAEAVRCAANGHVLRCSPDDTAGVAAALDAHFRR
ncbi:MAG: glycosyltransferase [Pseudomonadota bacterium]